MWCMILSNETLGNQITFRCLVDVLHYCAEHAAKMLLGNVVFI